MDNMIPSNIMGANVLPQAQPQMHYGYAAPCVQPQYGYAAPCVQTRGCDSFIIIIVLFILLIIIGAFVC